MKSLRKKIGASPNHHPGIFKRGMRKLKFGLMACAAAGTFACAAPLVEKPRTPTPVGDLLRPVYSVDGTPTTLTYLNKTRTVYSVTDMAHPVIRFKAPAEITLNFYPVVPKDRFDSFVKNKLRFPLISRNITTFSGWPRSDAVWSSYHGKTRESDIEHSDVPSKSVVGTPIRITVKLGAPPGKKRHTFGVTGPKGFVEVVSVKPLQPVPSRTGFYRRRRIFFAPSAR